MSGVIANTRFTRRLVTVLFATFALLFGFAALPQAIAADNPGVKLSFHPLTKSTLSGKPEEGPVRVGDLVQAATVDVPANGDPVFSPELPIGTVCTITEEDPAADPATADYTVTKAAPQEVTISHTTEINPLVFVNTYKKHQGTVKVKKTVTGVEAADTAKVPATVTLSYTVNDVEDPANVIEVPTTGAETTLPKTFDVGAKIKFKAETGAAIAGYSLDTNFGDELTVVKGDNPVVTVANTYSKDMGQVKVQKLVKGIDAAQAPANVTLKYTVDGGPTPAVR